VGFIGTLGLGIRDWEKRDFYVSVIHKNATYVIKGNENYLPFPNNQPKLGEHEKLNY